MSEKQPTHQELPPEVIGDWELTAEDRKLLGIPEPDGDLQSNNPYAKLAEAGDEALESQDFYSKSTAENPFAKLASADEEQLDSQDFYADQKDATTHKETTTEDRVLDFDPIGSDGTYVVKRTSGNMDDGWIPKEKREVTDTSTGEKYWTATVYKDTEEGRLSKTVRIDELRGWNTPVAESHSDTPNNNETEANSSEENISEISADQQEQEQNEAELKAGEILSFSEQLRMMIRETASEDVTAISTSLNKARAFLGKPRIKLLERRLASAQKKYDRISAKQDRSRFALINNRRNRKAAEAYQKLQESVSALESRNNVVKARETSVAEKGDNRREAIEQRKRDLMEKRIEAQTHKQERAERRARRLNKVEGESYKDREARVSQFTEEDYRRMRRLAIEALKSRN